MFVVEKRMGGLSEGKFPVRNQDSGLRGIDMSVFRMQSEHGRTVQRI